MWGFHESAQPNRIRSALCTSTTLPTFPLFTWAIQLGAQTPLGFKFALRFSFIWGIPWRFKTFPQMNQEKHLFKSSIFWWIVRNPETRVWGPGSKVKATNNFCFPVHVPGSLKKLPWLQFSLPFCFISFVPLLKITILNGDISANITHCYHLLVPLNNHKQAASWCSQYYSSKQPSNMLHFRLIAPCQDG